ncbi:MAG: tyrosine recombinase XerC [SAR202 cluster bacterium]|nr:tyrosine recombinase XerC [SAR202 cluster bacterium]
MQEHEWRTLIAAYSDHLKAEKGLSPYTVRNYDTDIEPLHQFMLKRKIESLKSLDRYLLRGYLAWLIELGYAKASIVRKLSALRTFLAWLLREGIISSDPLPGKRMMKRERRLPRFLSQEDAAKLVDSPVTSEKLGMRDHALLELVYAGGLRVSEAQGLDVQNVNLHTKEIRVRGKGSKERVVLIGDSARDALYAYLQHERPRLVNGRSQQWAVSSGQSARSETPSEGNAAGEQSARAKKRNPAFRDDRDALFLNYAGGRLSQRSIQEKVREYAKRAGLPPDVHTHTLRHSFATHLLDGGMDLRVVQELMGHSSPATTQIYTHVTQAKARQVYLGAHPRAKAE